MKAMMINSAVIYALAFNLIFFIQEVFLVIGKKVLGLESYLYHNNHTWSGQHPDELLMQGAGALGIFILGLLCSILFNYLKHVGSQIRLFILWMGFHGIIQSLPQIVVAYLEPKTDVGQALVDYLQLSELVLIILAIAAILSIPAYCYWIGRQLLGFVSSEEYISNPRFRSIFIKYIGVGAALLGTLLIIPFRLPPLTQVISPILVMLISIPWVWVLASIHKEVESMTSTTLNDKVLWTPVILLILLLIFFQGVLSKGVSF